MKPSDRLRLLNILWIFIWLLPMTVGKAAPAFQGTTPQERAQDLLVTMTPEERVGQLFLVTFYGPEAGAGSATGVKIYDLIVNHHIGGVILKAENDNFVGTDQTIPIAYSLIDQLQRNEYIASQQILVNPTTEGAYRPAFIPLFIGISQEGDGYPYDQLLSGLTNLPSQMSIGATWQPDLARQVGSVLGSELSLMGFNLLLGPSLDVLETRYSESGAALGVSAFGGDPFWVGEMGKAYITGIHQGSEGHMAVVAKHFPGFGGSDRLPEEEVATVRSSLEQLKQVDLAPFFAITGNAPNTEATADALLTSHVRYQGFQGNIRATTKPVSFDPQAFSQLMSLPQFSSWRDNGGVMISDDLGSRAVRRFYDPTGETFNGRLVALEAFLAGNDMLYLGNFVSSGDADSYETIINTLTFFAQKYREDTAFAQRVDQSVLRILSLKYHLYGNQFTLSTATVDPNTQYQLGRSSQVTFEIAKQSATLISPSLDELGNVLPNPPGRNDHIVFITDTRIFQQCSNCRQEYLLGVDSLKSAVLRLYSSSGQVLPGNLLSYSYQDLKAMLDAGTGVLQIENDLRDADWIVFSTLNTDPAIPSSLALLEFLNKRPDLYQQKKLIVFALNAPYYLDATDISKLTAYYGLYSRSDKFIEVAARLLFKELQPVGALSVSVTGVDYNLIEITSPDPDQIISLILDIPGAENQVGTPTPEATQVQSQFRIGDTITVHTGVIFDHNGRLVPDNTPVRFILTYEGDTLPSQQAEAQTIQGIAKASLRVDRAGLLHIRAESDPALTSDILSYDIPPESITATVPPPTDTPTSSPTATDLPTITPTVTPTPTVVPTSSPPRSTVNTGDWLAALGIALVIGVGNFWLALRQVGARWAVRIAFLALIGGLLTYIYLALGLPGSDSLIQKFGLEGVILVALSGSGIGAASAWLWHVVRHFALQKA
jgi:beta-N-acetylhexosaminidase